MKKTFPIIVLLVSLSLLGLIAMQYSWLNNLLALRKEQVLTKTDQVGVNIVTELQKVAYNGPSLRFPKKQTFRLGNDFLRLLKPQSIQDKYSKNDIYKKIRDAFDDEGLKKLQFEFAVTDNNDEIEMQTTDFAKAFWDTTYSKTRYTPIIPESGTALEGIGPTEHLIIVVPNFDKQVWHSLQWVLIAAAVFMLIIIAAFYVTVRTLLNQKKLSEIKSDFINNMTHEFKTPLATISLAIDAIKNEKVQNDKTKLNYFSGIIKEENKRMNKHVETILQAALLDKQELQLNLQALSVHAVINEVLENFSLQLKDKNALIDLHLDAEQDDIKADEIHFTNLISNLIDNALKYAKETIAPHIIITTQAINNNLICTIEDNGIGMNKETVKRVFEKFYRAHTGNVHNVKGFGLGMSYVKSVIDAHGGKIRVDSVLGKGTTFIVEVPLAKNTNT
ncbi:MAG: HAMP domain-containing histidine kinase [Bacteroidetes bacterium]|nr:HAMP domain-containing histidine kinase [Bacteroidota bacterium]